MLNIYFIRHCQTDYTPEGLIRDEKHLCKDGRQQAIELKKQLQKSKIHFDALYTSDMVRGIETITPYALEEKIKIISKHALQEINVNGTLHIGNDILKNFIIESKGNNSFKNPGWETLVGARKRYFSIIEKIIKKHQSWSILIVTHWLIFREFLKHHFPADPIDQLVISNPDVYKVQVKNNKILSYDREKSLVPENAVTRAHS